MFRKVILETKPVSFQEFLKVSSNECFLLLDSTDVHGAVH